MTNSSVVLNKYIYLHGLRENQLRQIASCGSLSPGCEDVATVFFFVPAVILQISQGGVGSNQTKKTPQKSTLRFFPNYKNSSWLVLETWKTWKTQTMQNTRMHTHTHHKGQNKQWDAELPHGHASAHICICLYMFCSPSFNCICIYVHMLWHNLLK